MDLALLSGVPGTYSFSSPEVAENYAPIGVDGANLEEGDGVERAEIERAVVKLTNKGGQGVYVGSEMILTAAHCVNFSTEGQMVLGDYYIEDIETAVGELKVEPLYRRA